MKRSSRERLPVSKPSFQQAPDSHEQVPASEFSTVEYSDNPTKLNSATPPSTSGVPLAKPLARSKKQIPLATPMVNPSSVVGSPVEIVVDLGDERPFELADVFTRRWMARNSSFVISFLFHFTAIMLFSIVVIHSTGKALIVLEILNSPDVEERDAVVTDIEIDLSDSEELVAALDDDIFNTALGDADGEQQIIDVGAIAATESKGVTTVGRGDGKSAKFFGTKAQGNSFVYVLDRSGSMAYESNAARNGVRVTRFDVARMELINSVESLQPHQEFYVVLFSTGMKQMFNQNELVPQSVKATPENKAKLKQWLWDDYAVGGTDPRESLKLAYKMNPDAIFMLSDGEFLDERGDGDPLSIDIARKQVAEKSPIRINSIALEDTNSKANLEELSNVSGGQFRFVELRDYLKGLPEIPDRWLANKDGKRNRKPARPAIDAREWNDRLKHAESMISQLEFGDAQERQEAEKLLHELSYELFVYDIPPVPETVTPNQIAASVEAWRDVWKVADNQSNLDTSTSLGMFSSLANVDGKDTLEMLESFNAPSMPPLHQVAFARVVLEYQSANQAVNQKTRQLLLGPLEELNKDSKATFGKERFLKSATLSACKGRLKKVLDSRRALARRLHTKSKNKKILEQVRIEHAKDLIRLYPETKLAREVAADLKLPVSHLDAD